MHGFTLCRNVTLFIIGSLLCIKKIFLPSSLLLSHQPYWWDLNPKMIILIFLTVITDIGKFKINWTYDSRKKRISQFPKFWSYDTLLGSETLHLIYVTKYHGSFVPVYGKMQREMMNWHCHTHCPVEYLSMTR